MHTSGSANLDVYGIPLRLNDLTMAGGVQCNLGQSNYTEVRSVALEMAKAYDSSDVSS